MTIANRVLGRFLALCVTIAAGAAPVMADESLGAFTDWRAFSYQENGQLVCYMATQAVGGSGAVAGRASDDVWLLVTHRPFNNERGAISVMPGYEYKDGAAVAARIGDKTFPMTPAGNVAWPQYAEDEPDMIDAMIAGLEIIITGVAAENTRTTDTFSLRGFTAAYREISRACGVN